MPYNRERASSNIRCLDISRYRLFDDIITVSYSARREVNSSVRTSFLCFFFRFIDRARP